MIKDLSIIIPIYNGEQYLHNTIGEILKCSLNDFEVILVNDGSSDDSEAICKEFSDIDSRVKYYSKTNGGIADARNFGLQKAQGEYIAFSDQDDKAFPELLCKIVKKYSNNDVILFQTEAGSPSSVLPCDIVFEEGEWKNDKDIFDYFTWPLVYPTAVNKKTSYSGHVWGGIYKKELIKQNDIKFESYISIEDDFVFMLNCFLHAKSIATCKDTAYIWCTHPESTTYNPKYIVDLDKKCINYYENINERLSFSRYFPPQSDDFWRMAFQVSAVRIVINEGIFSNRNTLSQSLCIIKTFLADKRQYMTGSFLGQGAARKSARYIFIFLQIKCYLFAICLSRLISLYKHFHKMGRKQVGFLHNRNSFNCL